ncbi:hypothetical protein OKW21_004558 [Catalinimonas alkaloidigena]|nr:hypothetical protein [Catalinimonas alkaloidigena]MDF9799295.1 hypothetical protein [Catalinimonas alkaloidigena]
MDWLIRPSPFSEDAGKQIPLTICAASTSSKDNGEMRRQALLSA